VGARQTCVVCDPANALVLAELGRVGFPAGNIVFNPDPARGMFSSIQCAAEWRGWSETLTHWAIALGDQPQLREGTLRATLAAVWGRPESVWQPAVGGRPRHPVILPRAAFGEIARTRAATLRDFLDGTSVSRATIDIDDPGLDADIDTPVDYERERARASPRDWRTAPCPKTAWI